MGIQNYRRRYATSSRIQAVPFLGLDSDGLFLSSKVLHLNIFISSLLDPYLFNEDPNKTEFLEKSNFLTSAIRENNCLAVLTDNKFHKPIFFADFVWAIDYESNSDLYVKHGYFFFEFYHCKERIKFHTFCLCNFCDLILSWSGLLQCVYPDPTCFFLIFIC